MATTKTLRHLAAIYLDEAQRLGEDGACWIADQRGGLDFYRATGQKTRLDWVVTVAREDLLARGLPHRDLYLTIDDVCAALDLAATCLARGTSDELIAWYLPVVTWDAPD